MRLRLRFSDLVKPFFFKKNLLVVLCVIAAPTLSLFIYLFIFPAFLISYFIAYYTCAFSFSDANLHSETFRFVILFDLLLTLLCALKATCFFSCLLNFLLLLFFFFFYPFETLFEFEQDLQSALVSEWSSIVIRVMGVIICFLLDTPLILTTE